MINSQLIIEQIVKQKNVLRTLGVVRMGIFGSVVHGNMTDSSDVDVLVEYNPAQKTYRNFYNTSTLLESVFKRPVDLVTVGSISPYIKPHILKDIHYVQIAD